MARRHPGEMTPRQATVICGPTRARPFQHRPTANFTDRSFDPETDFFCTPRHESGIVTKMRLSVSRIVCAAVFVAGVSWSPEALAVPYELRPGTKANNFEFGPRFGYGFGAGHPFGSAWLDYLYHFRRDQSGPAIGAAALIGGWRNYFGLASGFMFEWDIRLVPSKNLGLYLGPHVVVGYGFRRYHNDRYHSFFGMVGPTLKLVVNDFWVFWARPVNFDVRLGGPFFGSLTSALGAGITW